MKGLVSLTESPTTLQRIKKHLALLTAFETFPLCFCLGFVCPLTCFGKPDWPLEKAETDLTQSICGILVPQI